MFNKTRDAFSTVPNAMFQDKRLSLEMMRALGALLSFRGRGTNTVWPSRKKIAERCGMPVCKISEATTALEKLGWLKKEGKGGFSRATRYTITVPIIFTEQITDTEPGKVAHEVTRGVTDSVIGIEVAESVMGKEDINNISMEYSMPGQQRFVEFWAAYPRKKNRGDAEKAFRSAKVDDELLAKMLSAIGIAKQSNDWQKNGGQFIPYPATWLRNRCWEDGLADQPAGTDDDAFLGAI